MSKRFWIQTLYLVLAIAGIGIAIWIWRARVGGAADVLSGSEQTNVSAPHGH